MRQRDLNKVHGLVRFISNLQNPKTEIIQNSAAGNILIQRERAGVFEGALADTFSQTNSKNLSPADR